MVQKVFLAGAGTPIRPGAAGQSGSVSHSAMIAIN